MAGSNRWMYSSRPNAAEVIQFEKLYKLSEEMHLVNSLGADPKSWFQPDATGTYRSINDDHLRDINLAREGGIVALLCHRLREIIVGYLVQRQIPKFLKFQYPNDPLNCFFAELLECLPLIAQRTHDQDLKPLLDTVQARAAYLNAVASREIFSTSSRTSTPGETKGDIILAAIKYFGHMEQDISNIGTHRTLVQRLVGIDGVLKGFVMTGLDFAKTAYCADRVDISKISLESLLDNVAPKDRTKREAFLALQQSSLGRALLEALHGPAQEYAAPGRDRSDNAVASLYNTGVVAMRDMPKVDPTDTILHEVFRTGAGANSITRLIYMINTLARSAATLNAFIRTADDGGRLLVLGVCNKEVRKWIDVSSACLDEIVSCMAEFTREVTKHQQKLGRDSSTGNPLAHPWMRAQLTLADPKEGLKTSLLECCQTLRDQLQSFKQEVKTFNVREAALEATLNMRELTVRTNELYNAVVPSLGARLVAFGGEPAYTLECGLPTTPTATAPLPLEAPGTPPAEPNDDANGGDSVMVEVNLSDARDPQGLVVHFKTVHLSLQDNSTKLKSNVRVSMANPNPDFHKAFKGVEDLKNKTNVCFTYRCALTHTDIDVDVDSILALTDGIEVGPAPRTIVVTQPLLLKMKTASPAVRPSGVVDYVGLLGCNSLYEVLGVERDATERQIKDASNDLLRRVHSDKVHHSKLHMSYDEQQWVMNCIKMARDNLLDYKTRKEHDEFLAALEGEGWGPWFKRRMCELKDKFYAMHGHDGTNDHRWAYFWTAVALFAGGVAVMATVVTAGAALPIALGVGAAAGFMMAGGVGAAAYALNNAQSQFSPMGYLKHLAIYGLFGAATGMGIGALSMLGPYLGISVRVVEGLAEGAIESSLIGVAVGGADICVDKRLQSVRAGGIHMLQCIGISALAGAAVGAGAQGALGSAAAAPAKVMATRVIARNVAIAAGAVSGGKPAKLGYKPEDFTDDVPADDLPEEYQCPNDGDDECYDDDAVPLLNMASMPQSVQNMFGVNRAVTAC